MIQSIHFKVEGNHIIFDNLSKKKIKPINCVKFKEPTIPVSMMDNRGFVMRQLMKQAVIKIIIMI